MPNHDQAVRPGILKQDSTETTQTPSSLLGLKTAESPKAPRKAVSIASEASILSPISLGSHKEVPDLESDRERSRVHRVKSLTSRRLAGRPPQDQDEDCVDHERSSTASVVDQVHAWLKHERARHEARKAKRRERRGSDASEPDLDRLEQILKEIPFSKHRRDSFSKRSSIRKLLHKPSPSITAASDTDYFDGEPAVPRVEAWLDNTQIHRKSSSNEDLTKVETRSEQAWAAYKYEIVRLTHTLRLKGWRRVTMERSGETEVKRLSGALTNAVYVVTPPDFPSHETDATGKPVPRRRPKKLLLRVYGPQVDHLIDREAELEILKRLARKKIGPRMLGTFTNGRFEEYLHALPLTPKELRIPLVGEQIAKRMRELHEGIDLLDNERSNGPFVWCNWDKWQRPVGEVVTWLDQQPSMGHVCGTPWKVFLKTVERYRRWLTEQCGGSADQRAKLVFAHNDTQYGNILRITPSGTSPLLLPANSHKQLVVIDFEYASQNTPGLEFANHFTEWCYDYHDEKYSWRCNASLYPTKDEQSRFIRAYIKHRPDLEPQTPGSTPLEKVNESPIGSESMRTPDTARSLTTFLLDSRAPNVQSAHTGNLRTDMDGQDSGTEEARLAELIKDTRMWRTACSAQWVAWGIVQAHVPGMPAAAKAPNEIADTSQDCAKEAARRESPGSESAQADTASAEAEMDAEDEGAFDYLAYARDRAMFFWGDIVNMGFVKAEELPQDVQRDMKMLDY